MLEDNSNIDNIEIPESTMPRVVVEVLSFTPDLLEVIYTFPDLDDNLETFFLRETTNNLIKLVIVELFLTKKEGRDR